MPLSPQEADDLDVDYHFEPINGDRSTPPPQQGKRMYGAVQGQFMARPLSAAVGSLTCGGSGASSTADANTGRQPRRAAGSMRI